MPDWVWWLATAAVIVGGYLVCCLIDYRRERKPWED